MKTKNITLFSILWFIICMCFATISYILKLGMFAIGAPTATMAASHATKEVKSWYGDL